MKRSYRNQKTVIPQNQTFRLLTGNGIEIDIILDGFLEGRRGLSPGTLRFYREKLTVFGEWCKGIGLKTVEEISPSTIRDFFEHLEERGASEGGKHAYFRAMKAMLHWYEEETDYEYKWQRGFSTCLCPGSGHSPGAQVALQRCTILRD